MFKKGHSPPIAVAKLPDSADGVATSAEGIADAVDNDNEHFPTKPPIVAKTKTDVGLLRTAIQLATSRAVGTADERDRKVRVVRRDVDGLVYEVQGVANTLPPEEAQLFIVAMHLQVSESGRRPEKEELKVSDTDTLGTVILEARSLGRVVTYYYEYSTDQLNWVRVKDTHHPMVEISGLVSGQLYYFRFSALVGDEEREPCTAVKHRVR